MALSREDIKTRDLYIEKLKLIKENHHVNLYENASDKAKRVEKAKKDYSYFVSYYFPHYAEAPCADFHINAANAVLRNENFTGIMEWARGLAKSTHFDIFIPTWLYLFHGQIKTMLLIGQTESKAKKLLSDLQAEFEANEQLRHDFGTLVQAGSWETGNFITKDNVAFFSLGIGQSPRGCKNGPNRPDYMVVDDVDDDEMCRNPRRVDDSVEWINRALIPAFGRGKKRFILVNNRIAKYSILAKLAENPKYKVFKVNALDKNGNPSWPAQYSKAHYDDLLGRIGWPAFSSEYMNDPLAEGKIFLDKYIQWRPMLKLSQYERIVSHWDVAYSESKTADTNAIAIIGLSGIEKHVLKFFCDNCTMESALRWMYNLQLRLPKTIIIEWYAERQFWNTAVEMAIQTVSKEFGFRIPIIFSERPGHGSNKYSRIIQMLPAFQRGEFYFNIDEQYNLHMQRAIEQIKGIEPGYRTKDDAPDTLEAGTSKLEASRRVADSTPMIGMRERPKKHY